MIKTLAIALSLPLLVLTTFAQDSTVTTAPAPSGQQQPPEHKGPPREMLEKLASMTPAQRAEFLQTHPRLQKFVQNHPDFAQKMANRSEAGPGIHDPGHPRVNEVNQREQNQEQKIAQGVSNGSLTSQQAAHLQGAENRIKQQEANDLAKNNGHLTKAEDRQLNREENRVNQHIKADERGAKGKHHKGGAGGGAAGTPAAN